MVLAEAAHEEHHLWLLMAGVENRINLRGDEFEHAIDTWLENALHLVAGHEKRSIFHLKARIISYAALAWEADRHALIRSWREKARKLVQVIRVGAIVPGPDSKDC